MLTIFVLLLIPKDASAVLTSSLADRYGCSCTNPFGNDFCTAYTNTKGTYAYCECGLGEWSCTVKDGGCEDYVNGYPCIDPDSPGLACDDNLCEASCGPAFTYCDEKGRGKPCTTAENEAGTCDNNCVCQPNSSGPDPSQLCDKPGEPCDGHYPNSCYKGGPGNVFEICCNSNCGYTWSCEYNYGADYSCDEKQPNNEFCSTNYKCSNDCKCNVYSPSTSCSNECSGSTVYRCSGNVVQWTYCGNYDSDSCTEIYANHGGSWYSSSPGQNCDASDRCAGTTYRDYYCSSGSCYYSSITNDPRCCYSNGETCISDIDCCSGFCDYGVCSVPCGSIGGIDNTIEGCSDETLFVSTDIYSDTDFMEKCFNEGGEPNCDEYCSSIGDSDGETAPYGNCFGYAYGKGVFDSNIVDCACTRSVDDTFCGTTDCPDDCCVGNTFYDYPVDFYRTCDNGLCQPTSSSCIPTSISCHPDCHCDNGIKDCDEEGIDCGGLCPDACPSSCGDGNLDQGEECEPKSTSNNNNCDQIGTKCDTVNRKYCTRDGFGNCDNNCQCIEDPWSCGSTDDSSYCNNCNHIGDGYCNCGEDSTTAPPGDNCAACEVESYKEVTIRTAITGEKKPISLSYSVSPTPSTGSITAVFDPPTINPPSTSSVMKVTINNAPAGMYTITITGSDGDLAKTTTYILNVPDQ